MLEVDVNTYLPGDLITKIDIATMAYALEARSPLLDHEVMEFAASIPADLKVRGQREEVDLSRGAAGLAPDEILDRPKQGFSVPIAEWFRNELHDLVRDVLLDASTARSWLLPTPRPSGRCWTAIRPATDSETKPLWALFMFELWHREFVDRAPMPAMLATAA